MAKRMGGTPAPTRPAAPVIDVTCHRSGLADAAAEVRDLVARLQRGVIVLQGLAQDAPERGEGERLWQDLTLRLYSALRDAYARFALLRIAIGNETALALWDELMPTADALQEIGVPQMISYWRGRTEPVEWLTHQEAQFVTQSLWPPRGTDPIGRALEDFYEPPPFD